MDDGGTGGRRRFLNFREFWPMNRDEAVRAQVYRPRDTLTQNGGTIGSVQQVISWKDRFHGDLIRPYDAQLVGPQIRREPSYSATGRNGKPGISFKTVEYLYLATTRMNAMHGGCIFCSWILDRWNSTQGSNFGAAGGVNSETLSLMFADDVNNTDLRYMGLNVYGSSNAGPHANDLGNGTQCLTIRTRLDNHTGEVNTMNGAGGTGVIPNGNTGIVTGTEYKFEISNLNDGTTAGVGNTVLGPYRMYINNVQQAGFVNQDGDDRKLLVARCEHA